MINLLIHSLERQKEPLPSQINTLGYFTASVGGLSV